MKNEDLLNLKDQCEKAFTEACDIASGKRKWTMCVPARNDDSDLILAAPLTTIPKFIDELIEARKIIKQLVELKTIKETSGQTMSYLERKQIAWKAAFCFLYPQKDELNGTT